MPSPVDGCRGAEPAQFQVRANLVVPVLLPDAPPAYDYLRKPVRLRQLVAKIQQFLE